MFDRLKVNHHLTRAIVSVAALNPLWDQHEIDLAVKVGGAWTHYSLVLLETKQVPNPAAAAAWSLCGASVELHEDDSSATIAMAAQVAHAAAVFLLMDAGTLTSDLAEDLVLELESGIKKRPLRSSFGR